MIKRNKGESLNDYTTRALVALLEKVKEDPAGKDEKKQVQAAVQYRVSKWPFIALLVFAMSFCATMCVAQSSGLDQVVAEQAFSQMQDEVNTPVKAPVDWWAIAGIIAYAVYEVLVRLKPTDKDWSLLSLFARLLETFLPNKGPQVYTDPAHEPNTKWIGGQLWQKLRRKG